MSLSQSSGRYVLPTGFNFKIQCNHWKTREICSFSYAQFSSAVSGGYNVRSFFPHLFLVLPYTDTYPGEMVFLMACGHCLPVFGGIVWAPSPVERILFPQSDISKELWSQISAWCYLSSSSWNQMWSHCLSTTIMYWKTDMMIQQSARDVSNWFPASGKQKMWLPLKGVTFGAEEKGKSSL